MARPANRGHDRRTVCSREARALLTLGRSVLCSPAAGALQAPAFSPRPAPSSLLFVERGVDPTTDERQTLVYRGSDRHVKLVDENLTNDAAYYYSVFAAGDDGAWHLQLTDTVAPRSSSHCHRVGYDDHDDDSLQRVIDMDLNRMSW